MSDYQAFVDFRELCREPLLSALTYFLEDADEAKLVAERAWEQAGRQWDALAGEVNTTNLIAQAASDQCELLLPRPIGEPERRVPTQGDLVRHLEWNLFNKRVENLRERIVANRKTKGIEAAEEDANDLIKTLDDVTRRHLLKLLGWTDDQDEAGGATPVMVMPPPPFRGPGEGRTFDEALAAPRNP